MPSSWSAWMFVLHALGYVVIFAFFFVHLYLVTIGAPGSAPAMFTGWVTRGWVKKQHPKWLKEMEKDGTLVVYGEGKASGKRRVDDGDMPVEDVFAQ